MEHKKRGVFYADVVEKGSLESAYEIMSGFCVGGVVMKDGVFEKVDFDYVCSRSLKYLAYSFIRDWHYHFDDGYKYQNPSIYLFERRVARFMVGKTYEEVREGLHDGLVFYRQDKYWTSDLPFVGKTTRPRFECEAGNKNRHTFDFVKISMFLTSDGMKNYKEYFTKYSDEIFGELIGKIEPKLDRFYGVPVNFLRLSDVRRYGDEVAFIFELKEV